MATYVKFEIFSEDLASAVHDLNATGDTLKLYLTNSAPNAATHAVKGDLAGISEENGYAAADVQNDISRSGGTTSLTGVDVTWTATAGGFGPFRYVVLYNEDTTVKTDPLIAYWDYGSSISVSEGEDFLADIGTELFTLA
jgi:hypothetical protein